MEEPELRAAIAKPAEQAKHPLDEATINLLIEQTEGREGALPLLQFALTRIWEGLPEKEPAVTLGEIGGVGGALAGEAQRLYDSLDENGQAIVKRAFLAMVHLGEGTRDTRRRVNLQQVVTASNDETTVRNILQLFSRHDTRLVTLSGDDTGDTIEVTHEALLGKWQELNEWLDDSRDDLRFQRRLENAVQHWDHSGRPNGLLWRPPDLELLSNYQKIYLQDMTPLQVDFADTSQLAEEKRIEEKEAQQKRELETSKKLAASNARVVKQTRTLLYAMVLAFLGMGLLAWNIYTHDQNTRSILAQNYISTANQYFEKSQTLTALHHLAEADSITPLPYMSSNARLSIALNFSIGNLLSYVKHEGDVWGAIYNDQGTRILSYGGDGVRQWDAITGNPIGVVVNHEWGVRGATYNDKETLSTLRFGYRAKSIKNKAKVN